MAIIDKAGACVALAGILLLGGSARALSAADKCEAAKNKIAGKYAFCRQKAEAKAVKIGGAPDFSTCDLKFSDKWAKAETTADGMCPSNGDQATVQAFVSQHTNALGVALAGGMLPACGNGVIDPAEQCDQSNLNGQTCLTQGFAAGVLKCGAGCMFDTSGCSAGRFLDNGDGTVSDLQTGLMWEKKTRGQCFSTPSPGFPIACMSDSDCVGNGGGGTCVCPYDTCPHFVGATYTWNNSPDPCSGTETASSTDPNGTAFTDFLYHLNTGGTFNPYVFGYSECTSSDGSNHYSGGFAGHCDWRLPTVAELQTIVDPTQGFCGGGSGVCIDPALGPTQASNYWSSTTTAGFYNDAWEVAFIFLSGPAGTTCKTSNLYARAVRGGS